MTGPAQLLDHDMTKLTARRRRLERVAEMFQGGNKSTFEIAADLGISEEEVCGLLADVLRGGW
jgi:DNA-binding transcriptional regulator LsrR (DeoR family)